MLQTLLLMTAAHTAAICELPPTSAPIAPALSSTLSAERDRPPWLERRHQRRLERKARREHPKLAHTLDRVLRPLRWFRSERRSERSHGPLARFRDRRGRGHTQEDIDLANGQVTVPHEDPVDLPLYPQPNQ